MNSLSGRGKGGERAPARDVILSVCRRTTRPPAWDMPPSWTSKQRGSAIRTTRWWNLEAASVLLRSLDRSARRDHRRIQWSARSRPAHPPRRDQAARIAMGGRARLRARCRTGARHSHARRTDHRAQCQVRSRVHGAPVPGSRAPEVGLLDGRRGLVSEGFPIQGAATAPRPASDRGGRSAPRAGRRSQHAGASERWRRVPA